MTQSFPQLHLDISTHVFLDASSQLVCLREATRAECAMRAGLQPLLYYGLLDPSRPHFNWYVYPALLSEPVAPHQLLSDLWMVEPKPQRILVGRRYEEIFPGSIDSIRSLCEVDVAASSNRSYNIRQRWLREQDWSLAYKLQHRTNTAQSSGIELDALTALRQRGLAWFYAEKPLSVEDLTRSIPRPTVMKGHVIKPSDFPYQASLPPRSVGAIEADRSARLGRAWDSIEAVGIDSSSTEIESVHVSTYDGLTEGFELADVVAGFWPGGPAQIARETGLPRRELQWFLQGKRGLDRLRHGDLMSYLGLSYNENWDSYEPTMGLCVNVGKQTVASFVRLYGEFSRGGDCEFSFEPVPVASDSRGRPADPSFRFLVMQAYGGPLLLAGFQRGSTSASRVLDTDSCLSFTGPSELPPELYQSIVDTFAKANARPAQMWKLLDACARRIADQRSSK